MNSDNLISQDTVKSLFYYDEGTGVFTWRSGRKKGRQAGCARNDGYRLLLIKGSLYYAHRIAWLYVYCSHPVSLIDHIDGDASNNSIKNIREVSKSGNAKNTKVSALNKSRVLTGILQEGLWY